MDDNNPQIDCAKHGRKPWNGQVICAKEFGGCGRVWHLGDKDHALYPPKELGTKCVCKAELSGGGASRALCPSCFEVMAQRQQEGEA